MWFLKAIESLVWSMVLTNHAIAEFLTNGSDYSPLRATGGKAQLRAGHRPTAAKLSGRVNGGYAAASR